MPPLPTVGGDNNAWGSGLNTWLVAGHNADGSHNFAALTHTRSLRIPLLNPSGTFPLIIPSWRVPFAITVTGVYAYRAGGTGATVNVRKVSGVTPTTLLAADYSVITAGAWSAAGALVASPSPTLAIGDSLEALFQSITGTPSFLAIQIDYTEPVQ